MAQGRHVGPHPRRTAPTGAYQRRARGRAAELDAQSINTNEGGESRGFDAGKRTTGRKRHVIVDTMCLLLVIAVTSASVQDHAGGRTVLARLADTLRSVGLVGQTADTPTPLIPGSFPGPVTCLDVVAEIVKRTDDRKGFQVLPRRWAGKGPLAGWSAIATRPVTTKRLTATSEAMIKVATIRLMLVRIAGQPTAWTHDTHRHTARQTTIENLITQ
ncbi:transposase [Streptomyces sp. NPDC058001]|uniref:transposase n=1 Tax=Streptomyces sp. NPDC058001 TaxID=3346300 RepID=UPI0036EDFD8A